MNSNDWDRIRRDLGVGPEDPLGPLLTGLGRLEAALERPPVIDRAELRKEVRAALSGARTDVLRLLGWRAACAVVAVAALAGSLGVAGGWWWHGEQQLVAGISTGQSECRPERGGEACVITFWKRLPTR